MMDSRFSALPLDWQRAISQFLADVEAKSGSAKSAKTYRDHLGQFFDLHSDPAIVTRGDVGAFLAMPRVRKGHQGEPISPSTRNARRATLQVFYQYASEFEIDAGGETLYQSALPTRGYHDVKVNHPHKSMSADQLEKFFSAIDAEAAKNQVKALRDKVLFTMYLVTCRRREELARLLVSDLEETILIDGNERRRGICFTFFGKGKSRVADSQELPSFLYEMLISYWQAAGRYPPAPTEAVFTPLFHGVASARRARLSGSWINIAFKAYCKKAGLPANLTLHSTRHGGARARIESGATLKQVQTILRHKHSSTTELYIASITTAQDTGLAALQSHLPFLASPASK